MSLSEIVMCDYCNNLFTDKGLTRHVNQKHLVHKCVACDYRFACKQINSDDCDCFIYCNRCEEARQETPA